MSIETNSSFGRFTGQLTASDPLQTLFQLLTGRIPVVSMVKHYLYCTFKTVGNLANRSHVQYALCPELWEWKVGKLEAPSGCHAFQRNRRPCRPTEGHRHHGGHTRYGPTAWQVLMSSLLRYTSLLLCVALPRAASKGLVHAAHVCYLTASVPFGGFMQKADRLVLLGSSHRWAAPAWIGHLSFLHLLSVSESFNASCLIFLSCFF